MTTKQITIERLSVASSRPFEHVVATLDAAIGHPDMSEFSRRLAASKTYNELEHIVSEALGKSGFMEFARYDQGAVLRTESQQHAPKIIRLVIGNPLIMKEMVKHVTDAGSYAPVTILIDDRPDGVHLSYDKVESLLAPYRNSKALEVARDLDDKVERLLVEAAAGSAA